ncbi:hypothetical protein [Endozoicomonas sp. GU-1]|uniref:hypothetical protein n=1 Tax=Endozoicomonas sp. GU-1 TaxID=3009078 RepID=UPI0022B4A0FE|nr:hypothetical protein [Endozoicomonas sp. GU-1]WBA79556.1 hypothetical protein O2T12_14325 [Endozoicomonas sp. GU-1]
MTTIAWDGKTLASDSRMTCPYIFDGYTGKIRKITVGDEAVLIGVAGGAANAGLLFEWVESGMSADAFPQVSNIEAILVTGKGAFFVEDKSYLIPLESGSKHAVGSGCEYAMSAMMAGKNASKAVEIAIQLDTNSGGQVISMRLPAR